MVYNLHIDLLFLGHRKVSYPHIHQPLRSLSNKSLSKSAKSHKEKKKAKKKKKKEKLRSFPSQGAIKSPTIPEEEEEHFDPVDDDSVSKHSTLYTSCNITQFLCLS